MLTLQKSEFREETNFPRTPPYISVIVNGLEEESKLEKTINLRRIKIDGETTWCGTKGRVAPGKICALERAPLGIRPRINGGFYDSSFIHRSNYNGVSQTHRDIVAIKTDFQWENKSGGGGDIQCQIKIMLRIMESNGQKSRIRITTIEEMEDSIVRAKLIKCNARKYPGQSVCGSDAAASKKNRLCPLPCPF